MHNPLYRIATLALAALCLAPTKYHAPAPSSVTGYIIEDSDDVTWGGEATNASGCVWMEKYKSWVIGYQTGIGILQLQNIGGSVSFAVLGDDTDVTCAGDKDNEGVAVTTWDASSADADKVWVVQEGTGNGGLCVFDYDDLLDNNINTFLHEIAIDDADCGSGGNQDEGLTFMPDSGLSGKLYGNGYWWIAEQGTPYTAYRVSVSDTCGSTCSIDACPTGGRVTRSNPGSEDNDSCGMDTDFYRQQMYWIADNDDRIAGETYSGTTLLNQDHPQTGTFEGLCVNPHGHFCLANDGGNPGFVCYKDTGKRIRSSS